MTDKVSAASFKSEARLDETCLEHREPDRGISFESAADPDFYQVCVVTGAARGLGNLMARTFAESGANSIIILDLDEALAKQAAVDLVDWFEEHGGAKKGEISSIGMGCDVGNEQQVQECFGKIVEKYGRVDVLVTAAGIVGEFQSYLDPARSLLIGPSPARRELPRDRVSCR